MKFNPPSGQPVDVARRISLSSPGSLTYCRYGSRSEISSQSGCAGMASCLPRIWLRALDHRNPQRVLHCPREPDCVQCNVPPSKDDCSNPRASSNSDSAKAVRNGDISSRSAAHIRGLSLIYTVSQCRQTEFLALRIKKDVHSV